MFFHDSLFSKIGDPITAGVLFYLISVADADGNVRMSYADIGKALGYTKIKIQRCLRKLLTIYAIDTLPIRGRYNKTLITICNIECYKSGDTLKIHYGYDDDTLKDKNPSIEDRIKRFSSEANKYVDKYGKTMIEEFIKYWTEMNKNGRKMRFEKEKVFDISRRLARWKLNNYGNKNAMNIGMVLQNSEKKDYTKDLW